MIFREDSQIRVCVSGNKETIQSGWHDIKFTKLQYYKIPLLPNYVNSLINNNSFISTNSLCSAMASAWNYKQVNLNLKEQRFLTEKKERKPHLEVIINSVILYGCIWCTILERIKNLVYN